MLKDTLTLSLCDILKSYSRCLYPLSFLLLKLPVSLPPVLTVHPIHLHTLLNCIRLPSAHVWYGSIQALWGHSIGTVRTMFYQLYQYGVIVRRYYIGSFMKVNNFLEDRLPNDNTMSSYPINTSTETFTINSSVKTL